MNVQGQNQNFFKMACYFEGSLILVAIFLGWIAGINPFINIHFSETAIIYGLFGAILLFLVFVALYQINIDSLRRIQKLLLETLGPSMQKYHWADLFVLAAIAGISEEILFRGVIQPWMQGSWGMTIGLIGSNVIFGLVHAVTPLYALLAGLVGIYLGLFLNVGGETNLLTPIIVHGGYDFFAFLALMQAYRNQSR